MNPALALISVVVIGRNEGTRLQRCLESVYRIEGLNGPVELIYVDSGSTDGSREMAAALGAQVIELQAERPSAARGRNAGWHSARAPWVLFLDGDTVLSSGFVREAMAAMTDPEIAVVWGNRRELRPRYSIYNRVLDLDWLAPAGDSAYCGGDALMRRSVLSEVGGYDEALIAGEEPDLCRRMRGRGHRILHLNIPMTDHDLAITRWNQYWTRAVRTGHAYREVANRYRDTSIPLWAAESRANCQRGLFWLLAGSCALLALIGWKLLWPFCSVLGLLGGLSVRTARRFQWKSSERSTLILYGLHSHVQQIPIFFGQLLFWYSRFRGRRQELLEYKERLL